MAEPNGVDHGLPEPDDWLEWVPAEVQEAMRKPRFRRLTPDERIRWHGQEPQPANDERLARRLEEVEGVVDQAARSVTRRAERVRSMLADTLGAAGGDLPS